jgi:hypothetical protein
VYTIASLAPQQRSVVSRLVDARSGAAFSPIEALRRDLGDPLVPIASEADL